MPMKSKNKRRIKKKSVSRRKSVKRNNNLKRKYDGNLVTEDVLNSFHRDIKSGERKKFKSITIRLNESVINPETYGPPGGAPVNPIINTKVFNNLDVESLEHVIIIYLNEYGDNRKKIVPTRLIHSYEI